MANSRSCGCDRDPTEKALSSKCSGRRGRVGERADTCSCFLGLLLAWHLLLYLWSKQSQETGTDLAVCVEVTFQRACMQRGMQWFRCRWYHITQDVLIISRVLPKTHNATENSLQLILFVFNSLPKSCYFSSGGCNAEHYHILSLSNHRRQILTAVGWTWKWTRMTWCCLLRTMLRCWKILHTGCDSVFLSLWPRHTASGTLRINDACHVGVLSILAHIVALFLRDDCLQDRIPIILCQTWEILSTTVNIILTETCTDTYSGSSPVKMPLPHPTKRLNSSMTISHWRCDQ